MGSFIPVENGAKSYVKSVDFTKYHCLVSSGLSESTIPYSKTYMCTANKWW